MISDEIRVRNEADWTREVDPTHTEWRASYNRDKTEQQKARDEWMKNRRELNSQNIAKYMEPVPEKVRKMVGQYADRNYQVMNLFARCPGAEDLHHSNPALVMALANSWSFQDKPVAKPMRAARTLVYKKQKDILEWLGFPASESFRKTLAKIPPDCMTLKHLLWLRHWSRDDRVLKFLSHLDRINEPVIELVTKGRNLNALTPQLLAEISQVTNKHRIREIGYLFADTVAMGRRARYGECPTRFTSLTRLKAVHDTLVERMNRYGSRDYKDLPDNFPGPPFQGTPTIWPITTPKELYSEGAEQRNCVSSHAEDVLNGYEYVYRVHHPIRATFAIERTDEGWVPGQFEQSCNRAISDEIRQEIFKALIASGVPKYAVEVEEDDIDDDQLPLGMTQEAWQLVKRVEESFGRSQRISMELPQERISA